MRTLILIPMLLAACTAAPPPKPAADDGYASAVARIAIASCAKSGFEVGTAEHARCAMDTARSMTSAPTGRTVDCIPNALGGVTCNQH